MRRASKPNAYRVERDCAYLALTRKDGTLRAEAIIDVADLDAVLGRGRWVFNENRKGEGGYVRSSDLKVYLHAFLLGAGAGMQVDHRDMNRLNNRRDNLRLCSISENQANRTLLPSNRTGFKGVHISQKAGICARIEFQGVKRMACRLPSLEDAAHLYDTWAREMHGEAARLNFPLSGELPARLNIPLEAPERAVSMPRLFAVGDV